MGGVTAALLAFGVAALMMVLLMFTLALIIGAAQERTVEAMRAGAPAVKRWAGRILRISVGALMILVALIQLNRLNISLRRFEPAMKSFLRRQRQAGRVRKQRPFLRFTMFGFGYLAAGVG